MTIRLSRFRVLVIVPALICGASSAVLADSGAKYGKTLGDSLVSAKPVISGVSPVSVDDATTSSSSFSKMFGDLARQSEAAPPVLPAANLSTVAESQLVLPAATPSIGSAAIGSPARAPSAAAAAPMAPFSNNAKARVFGERSKQASPALFGQSGLDSTTGAQSAPLPPFTRLPSATLNDSTGGNQYLRQAAALIPNVQMTSPNLVRGSQPDGQTLSLLKEGGVTTIINLRNEDVLVAQEALVAKRLGLAYVSIPMNVFDSPSKEQITTFLAAIKKAPGKVYVHCLHGQDRTGTMTAMYRIAHDGWDANRAYEEMKSCGFRPYLGNLTAGVYNFSAEMGRPETRPVALSDMFSHFRLK